MIESILAKTLSSQDDHFEWLVDNSIQQGDLQALVQASEKKPLTLLLPATDVLLLEVNLPLSNQKLLKKAIPFAVEEWLTHDVESYHLVWSAQKNGKITAAAIAHERIKSCLHRINQAKITLRGLYSETLFLPVEPEGCSVLIERGMAVVRYKQWSGGGIEQDSLPLLIEKLSADHGICEGGRIWTTDACQSLSVDLTQNMVCEQINSSLHFFQNNLTENTPLNLLTGIYDGQHQSQWGWKPWLPALATFFLAIAIQYGSVIKSHWDHQAQLADLETKNQQLFKQAFPEVKRIVSLKTQAQQELLALRKTSSSSSSDFINLLYQCGTVMKEISDMQLQETSFNNGRLTMQVSAKAISQIEMFKEQMEKVHGISARIISAEANDKGVSARLEVSRKPT